MIAASQLKTLLGVEGRRAQPASRSAAIARRGSCRRPTAQTLAVGVGAAAFLFWVRKGLKPLLARRGIAPRAADVIVPRPAPVAAIAATTLPTWLLGWHEQGLKIVGSVPAGPAAVHAAVVGPGAVANAAAAGAADQRGGFRRIGVGGADAGRAPAPAHRARPGTGGAGRQQPVGAPSPGGFPVTGGFARSVVNFDAGAQHAGRGRVHRRRHRARLAAAHAGALLPAAGHAGRDHHRRRALAGRLRHPEAHLGLFEAGLRRGAGDAARPR